MTTDREAAGLFHITTEGAWDDAKRLGHYAPPSLRDEGFIHLSTSSQLLTTANRFYRGRCDLVVLSVERQSLSSPLEFEKADGDSFPHLYGPLKLDDVIEVVALPLNKSGAFDVPVEWHSRRHEFE